MAIPDTMRAMRLHGFGDVDQLQLDIIPKPYPQDDEVLIKVGACGVNNTDLNLRKGWYGAEEQAGWQQTSTNFPIIQGADIVGTVESEGDLLGQRVMVNPTIYKDGSLHDIDFIGSERDGGFAGYVAVPRSNVYPIDSALTDAELATFATSYLTALHMLEVARVQAGETVLITGASGGVGSALLQLVQARSAKAIAVTSTSKAEQARELGAIATIDRNTSDLSAALEAYEIDVVCDVVGGEQFGKFLDVVKIGGRIVTSGAIAGPIVEIDLRTLYLRHITLIGATLGTADEFGMLVQLIADGQIKPLLAATYPLEQLQAAQLAFEEKHHFGKIVIVP